MTGSKNTQGKFICVHAIKAYEGSGGIAHSFLIVTLEGGKWLVSRPSRFILVKMPRYF